jgi:hypothetical protein
MLLLLVVADLLIGPAMLSITQVVNALVAPASGTGTAGVILWTLPSTDVAHGRWSSVWRLARR